LPWLFLLNGLYSTPMETDTPQMTDGFTLALEKVQGWATGFYSILPNILVGLVILLIFTVFAYTISKAITAYFKRRDKIDLGNIVSDIGFWLFMVFGLLVALTIMIPSMNPADLVASFGIGSIAVGFAFKEILQNWFAGLLILLRAPFRRGDQVSLEEISGTVMRIEPRATIIRTYDGRDVVIPNTTVFSTKVIIQTSQEHRRVEMEITVGYDYEIGFVTEIIQQAFANVDEILKTPAPQVLCWELGATSLGLKLRWWIKSERANEVVSRARLVQALKTSFMANDIDPTDPSLVYSINSAPPEPQTSDTQPAKTKKRGKPEKPVAVEKPAKVVMDANDPETHTNKADSKDKTLLPQESDPITKQNTIEGKA